jgi:hypothetical protein
MQTGRVPEKRSIGNSLEDCIQVLLHSRRSRTDPIRLYEAYNNGFEKPLWLAEMLLVLGLLEEAICLLWARPLA